MYIYNEELPSGRSTEVEKSKEDGLKSPLRLLKGLLSWCPGVVSISWCGKWGVLVVMVIPMQAFVSIETGKHK